LAEILFLAPYPEIAEVAQKVCSGTNDVTIEVARMDEAVLRAQKAEQNGHHVLISRGVTSWKIRNSGEWSCRLSMCLSAATTLSVPISWPSD
jgi:propionate catabolism operon transcriptional regulator